MARPTPPSGYHVCSKAPQSPVMLIGGPYQHPDANWKYWNYEDTGGSGLIFIKMASLSLSDEYWLFPSTIACGTAVSPGISGKEHKIRELQTALNAQGYGLGVDGIIGVNTCGAAYDYQSTVVGVDSHQLTGDFFVSLGLPSNYAVVLGHDCVSWWTGDLPPWIPEPESETIKVTPTPDVEPEPDIVPVAGTTDKRKILAAVLGAVGGALVGVAIKTKWYPRAQAWAAAGAGGAAGLGAGLLVGMAAFKGQPSSVARLGLIQAQKARLGAVRAQKRRPPQGLGYVPPVVQAQWGNRGSVGWIDAQGSRKYW